MALQNFLTLKTIIMGLSIYIVHSINTVSCKVHNKTKEIALQHTLSSKLLETAHSSSPNRKAPGVCAVGIFAFRTPHACATTYVLLITHMQNRITCLNILFMNIYVTYACQKGQPLMTTYSVPTTACSTPSNSKALFSRPSR